MAREHRQGEKECVNAPTREAEWGFLMQSAISGDAAAYRRFLLAVTPHLRSLARRRCRQYGAPDGDAEDIVQEALLAIHLKRGTWDCSRPIGPWIAAIVRNKLIDALRRRGQYVFVPIDDVIDRLGVAASPFEAGRSDIDGLLAKLGSQQRDIVQSISINGNSVREAAGRFNMSETAVRVGLHRALKKLAALYRSHVA